MSAAQGKWLEPALVHYPVLNRLGETIGAAITNLDLHDIARAARTFGARRYWLVTPFAEQRQMAEEIIGHWRDGYGKTANPDRGEALALVRIAGSLDEARRTIEAESGRQLLVIATCARRRPGKTVGFGELRARLEQGEPCLLLFGTGWGLAPEVLEAADALLPPIVGSGDYNHLSVRSAAAIALDRLMGEREN